MNIVKSWNILTKKMNKNTEIFKVLWNLDEEKRSKLDRHKFTLRFEDNFWVTNDEIK